MLGFFLYESTNSLWFLKSGTNNTIALESQEPLDKGIVEIGALGAELTGCCVLSACPEASDGVLSPTQEKWLSGRSYCRGSGSRTKLYLGTAFPTISGYTGLPLLPRGWLCMSVPPKEEDAVVSQPDRTGRHCLGGQHEEGSSSQRWALRNQGLAFQKAFQAEF